MSRPVPFTLPGASPVPAVVPAGNRMDPSSSVLPVNNPGSWKPGQDQNTLTMRGQQKPRPPAVRPRVPFTVR